MIYIGRLKWFDKEENDSRQLGIFVRGDNYADVMETVADYYGDYEIETITLEAFSPDNLIEFDLNEDEELYSQVVNRLGERVVW